MGILDLLRGRKAGKKIGSRVEISHFELYEGAGGRRFKRVGAFSERVEFEDIFAARPGYTYSLRSRSKGGHLRTIWTTRAPGPLPVEERPADLMARYAAAIEPFLKIGTQITVLRESIRAAFPWAVPQDQGDGNPSTPSYVGSLPAILHPKAPELALAWTPFFKDVSEALASSVRKGLAATKSEGEAIPEGDRRFERPPPDPKDYL